MGRPLHTEDRRGGFKSHDEALGRAHAGVDGRRQRHVSPENRGAEGTDPHHEASGEEVTDACRKGPARQESSRRAHLRSLQTTRPHARGHTGSTEALPGQSGDECTARNGAQGREQVQRSLAPARSVGVGGLEGLGGPA